MNILYIAVSTVKRNLRDKRAWFGSILMPVLMILVLGTALSKIYEVPKLDKINVCFMNQDTGRASEEFNKFLDLKQIKDLLNVKEVSSISEGEKLINSKKAVSLIVIPDDYSKKLQAGKGTSIQIYNSKYTDYKNSIVENIVEVYNSVGNATMAIMKLSSKTVDYKQYSVIKANIISTKGNAPRMIDYYGVAMLVLAIMGAATFASAMISEDYFDNVAVRMKASPAKSYERLLGKILGCVFDTFIKGVIVIVFSKFVYKVNWGNNLVMVAVIILSAAVFSTLLGMFLTMAVGSASKATGILGILNVVFTFLAGGYAMIIANDVPTSVLMHLSPNFYPQAALLNVIYSNHYRVNIHFFNTFGYIAMLWGASALLFMGFLTFERKRLS